MRTGRPWETVRVKRLSSSKEEKGLEPCRHLSYLHERLREWPECIAGERKQGDVVCGLSAYVCRGGVGGGGEEERGGGATAAGPTVDPVPGNRISQVRSREVRQEVMTLEGG